MDKKNTMNMIETELLKRFILSAKATHAEHLEAIAWLQAIIEHYEQQLKQSQN